MVSGRKTEESFDRFFLFLKQSLRAQKLDFGFKFLAFFQALPFILFFGLLSEFDKARIEALERHRFCQI